VPTSLDPPTKLFTKNSKKSKNASKKRLPELVYRQLHKDLINKEHMESKTTEKKTEKPIKYVVFKLLYLGPKSIQVQTEINHFFVKINNDRIKARMVHNTCKLSKFFKVKGSQALLHRSNVVYHVKCICGESYIRETTRNLKTRLK